MNQGGGASPAPPLAVVVGLFAAARHWQMYVDVESLCGSRHGGRGEDRTVSNAFGGRIMRAGLPLPAPR